MKKDRIVFDFIKLTSAEKVAKGRSVEKEMTGNPSFVTPDVPMVQLHDATDVLETRIIAASTGGKEETALLHQAEEKWDDEMRLLARYVERIADGNGAIMLSAGFNLAKQPIPAQRPEFSVELGEKSGSVILRRQAVEGAKSYIWQIFTGDSPQKESDWTIAQVTAQATAELSGLTVITRYWFRVAVVTKEGTSAFSDPIMQVVI
jgi:hypothetical protein